MTADDVHRSDARLPRRAVQALSGRRRLRQLAIGIVLVAYCWVASGTKPFTAEALAGVLIPGVALAAIAYGRPPKRIPPPEHLDIAGFSYWMLGVALLFEWEAAAFSDGSHWWHPSLTDLVNLAIAAHPLRTVAMLLWLAVGWGLVKR
jgi:hypothetical protein